MTLRKHLPLLPILCGIGFCLPPHVSADPAKALDRYVAAKDPSFAYHVRSSAVMGGVEIAELQMVSQTWRGTAWKHRLFLVKPGSLSRPSQALLMITGGSWKEEYESALADSEEVPAELAMFLGAAEQMGSVVAVVTTVPFQPMYDGKTEDDLIAYTMARYLETADETWPLLLPMVKSATAAMDATQAYAREHWRVAIDHFTVSGASKRGWTTWLTGAVDGRVNAIVPIVIDMLNMSDQMHHQVDAWGSPSPMIHAYTDLGILDRLDTPRGRELRRIVDPYAYRDRLEGIQKTIVLGTNDAYWPVDAANLYWDALAGNKTLVYAANSGHPMRSALARVIGSLVATHLAAAGGLDAGGSDLPRPGWTYAPTPDGYRLEITLARAPSSVTLWWANAPARDFREARWQSRPIPVVGSRFGIDLARPDSGFLAAYASLAYPDEPAGFEVSTQVRVIGADDPGGPAGRAGGQ